MEKVNRSSYYFPPLAIPEAYKRRRLNTGLSKEGQTVRCELESNHVMNHFLKQNACKDDVKSGKEIASKDQQFCVACAQRASLQSTTRPTSRPTSRARKDNGTFSKGRIKGCMCILCSKELPLSPQAANHQLVINSNSLARKETNQTSLFIGNEQAGINREFQITPFDYDSRIENMQQRLECEQFMPSKEVMRRSERKCQLWLLRNEAHIRVRTNPQYKQL